MRAGVCGVEFMLLPFNKKPAQALACAGGWVGGDALGYGKACKRKFQGLESACAVHVRCFLSKR